LQKGVPFTPATDGLFFTEEEARSELQQKYTFRARAELAEETLERRDDQIEKMYESIMDYIKTSEQKDAIQSARISSLEAQNDIFKAGGVVLLVLKLFEVI
jgi:hypothetical protein